MSIKNCKKNLFLLYSRPFPLSFTLNISILFNLKPFPLFFILNLSILFNLKPFPLFFILNLSISIILDLSPYPFYTLYSRPFPVSFILNLSIPFSRDLSPYTLFQTFLYVYSYHIFFELFCLLILLVLILWGLSFFGSKIFKTHINFYILIFRVNGEIGF